MVNLSQMLVTNWIWYIYVYILYFFFLILLDFSTVRRQFCKIRFFYNLTFLLLQLDVTFCIYFKSLYFPRVGTLHESECPIWAHPFWALILYACIFSILIFFTFSFSIWSCPVKLDMNILLSTLYYDISLFQDTLWSSKEINYQSSIFWWRYLTTH